MRKSALGIVFALLAVAGVTTAAEAELAKQGNLLLTFNGGISPKSLPRTGMAPVTVWVDSTIKSTDGSDPPPQLQEISIGINRQGKIFDRGLPTCKVRRIQPATPAAARRICGAAILGRGTVTLRIASSKQPPFTFHGKLIAFKGSRVNGKRRILAQVYGKRPPSAFILPFVIHQGSGSFGTVIKTKLPKSARRWAYVIHFDMRLRRVYGYGGRRRSYISAGCPAPEGFPGAVYPFARARYTFAGGRKIESTLIRDCTVR